MASMKDLWDLKPVGPDGKALTTGPVMRRVPTIDAAEAVQRDPDRYTLRPPKNAPETVPVSNADDSGPDSVRRGSTGDAVRDPNAPTGNTIREAELPGDDEMGPDPAAAAPTLTVEANDQPGAQGAAIPVTVVDKPTETVPHYRNPRSKK